MQQMNAFFDNDASNYTIVNNNTFNQIAQGVLTTNATPALWFYAAGGSTLLILSLMCLINRWPRGLSIINCLLDGIRLFNAFYFYPDKYEWGQTISRLVLGAVIIVFSAVDVHASSDVLTSDFTYEGSRIWYLATHAGV